MADMSEKYYEKAKVVSQEMIADGIFRLRLHQRLIAASAKPGQFVSVYCKDHSRMLPRPISVCETDPAEGILTLVYRRAGEGTKEISGYQEGDLVDLAGPLGNGYPMERAQGRNVLLVGGGIGIPPLVELAKRLNGNAAITVGYRNEPFLLNELEKYGRVFCSSEDGSIGTKGTVLDCIKENCIQADVIYACGPAPMLRALKQYAQEHNIECWISLEERMACGVGACLACICRTPMIDEHSQVKNRRICADGPVFEAGEVEI